MNKRDIEESLRELEKSVNKQNKCDVKIALLWSKHKIENEPNLKNTISKIKVFEILEEAFKEWLI